MPIIKPPSAPIDVVNTTTTKGIETSTHTLQPTITPIETVKLPPGIRKVTR